MKLETKVTLEDVKQMREWLKDCCDTFVNLDEYAVDELTTAAVMRAVSKYYVGGIEQFLKDGGK